MMPPASTCGSDCWQPISDGHDANLAATVEQHTIAQHDEHLRAFPHHRRERLFKCAQLACFGRDKRQPQRLGGLSRRLQTLQIGRKVRIPQNAHAREVR